VKSRRYLAIFLRKEKQHTKFSLLGFLVNRMRVLFLAYQSCYFNRVLRWVWTTKHCFGLFDAKPTTVRAKLGLGSRAADFGMELLVSGRIIALGLPVALVFASVWRPAPQEPAADASASAGGPRGRQPGAAEAVGPPMPIVFRLQVRSL
jgi:E3 ubiquitin-protein ligase UBR4